MTSKGVRELITAGVTNKEIGDWLIQGYTSLALRHAKKVFRENDFEIDDKELRYLSMISAETMAGFADACNRLGITKEG